MPGIGGSTNDTATTRYRRTRLTLDVSDVVQTRPITGVSRYGHELARASQVGVGSSTDVMIHPGGSWTIKPVQADPNKIHERGDPDLQKAIVSYLAGHLNLAPGFVEHHQQKAPSDLHGVTMDPRIQGSGDPFVSKRALAGNWGHGLSEGTWPKPTTGELVRMNRVAESRITFPEDTGFFFRFKAPGWAQAVPDNLLTLHWGGYTGPPAQGGGAHAMTFHGNGEATFWENLAAAGWQVVKRLFFAPPNAVAGRSHSMMVVPLPQGRQNFQFTSSSRSQPAGRVPPSGNMLAAPPPSGHVESHVHSPLLSRYTLRAFTTGAGPVRVDQRQDQRAKWQVSRLVYPPQGVIEDHLFLAPVPLPAGAKATIKVIASRVPAGNVARDNPDPGAPPWPSGTHAIDVEIFDGTTRVALDPHGDGHDPEKLVWRYQANANQQQYYARITLRGDTYSSPVVEGIEIEFEPQKVDRAGLELEADVLEVSIVGPDKDPDHESMHVRVQDVKHEVSSLLETRGRIHATLDTQWHATDASKRVVLFEGEVAQADGEKWGMTDSEGLGGGSGRAIAYPSPDWIEWELDCVGMWARLKDQQVLIRKDFSRDEDAPTDLQGRNQAWKITAIIKWVFLNVLGVPQSMLNIPDLSIRLTGSMNAGDYILMPTADPLDYISRLAHDYLAMFLLYDANAGPAGMWRLKYQTLPGAAPVWSFVLQQQAGKMVHFEESYPASTTFIRRGHYRKRVKPPEFNFAAVTTTGQLMPEGAGLLASYQFDWNPLSLSLFPDHPTADPSSPDYLDGRFVPVMVFDSSLGATGDESATQAALSAYLDRLMQFGSHAQTWRYFLAPLVLFNDTSDTQLQAGNGRRPLRHQDPIQIASGVDGGGALIDPQPFVIWDVHPTYSRDEGGDDFQWAIVSAVNSPPE